MVGRAAINITGHNQSYFFKGDKYVKINWTPGNTDDTIQYGPTEFAKEWPSLKEAGFNQIDAILPIPGHDHRAYFFCGGNYARIEFTPGGGDKIVGSGVHTIEGAWPSLKKAGFKHVDGALLVPGRADEAYIFSGEQYCRVKFKEGQTDDELIGGPRDIAGVWSASGFKTIDTIIPRPGNDANAYLFCGDNYAQVKVNPGGSDELVGRHTCAGGWPSLHKAGFY
ncbi:unnamed protein product [Rhizoctonia solani]|uniref:Hemopexin n=1 Tax=Rhizoctonia solani TaxID=456999 RepID=A0A8H2XEC0_9AGAM|nr:unnamed protein product [Rhizoctonia solani]CAE6421568.1 unnamed protein product [Rhizoctonia solani]